MDKALERTGYFFRDGRLVAEPLIRTSTRAHWPLGNDPANLVLAIQETPDGYSFIRGPAATPSRITQAFLRHTRRQGDFKIPDIGRYVPEALVAKVSNHITAVIEKLTRNYQQLNIEDRQTGSFIADLNDGGRFELDGWEANIFVQGFSPITKEPRVGADIAAIFDVRRGDEQISKALWFQAKRITKPGIDPKTINDFEDQCRDMKQHTAAAFGLFYSPDGVVAVNANEPFFEIPVQQLFADAIRCRQGDRNPRVIAQSLDSSFAIETMILGTSAS